jgi:hypothetical protein
VTDPLSIQGEWREEIPLVVVDYEPAQMFLPKTSTLLAERLIAQYKVLRAMRQEATPRACILWVKSKTAGSPLVRAIFELYKVLNADEATLFCAGYPVDFLESLTSLGLPALPGFKITVTVEEAIRLARNL